MSGLAVCAGCGARIGGSDAGPFDRTSFRYRSRLYGAPLVLFQKLSTPVVRDGGDRPIARVEHRFRLRRAGAILVGALVFVATLLAYVWAIGELPDGWLASRLAMLPGIVLVLGTSLSVVALLSPGPEARLVSIGREPRTLLRFFSTRDGWTASELDVEDGDGVKIGTVVLHRFRNSLWPLGWHRPIATLSDGSASVDVKRASPFFSGIHFRQAEDLVGTFACNAGILTRDALEIADPPPVDPRLFVTAMIVARP